MSLLLTLGDTTPNPRTLFANNEPGLALDVEAAYLRGWVYQDSAGATVAAAAGDPVGLILDTAKGGLDQLGGDLVSNGTFASDTVWTKGANWTIGSGVATKTGGAANNLTQTISSTAGLWYRITMDVTRTAGTLTVSLGTSGTTYAITATGTYTFFILAGSSTQTLTLAGDSSFAGTVDNVTAKLVPGNHAYTTVSGSRPALARTPDGGRRNLLTRSEDLTVGASWGDGGTTATVSTNTIANPLNGEITADTINLQDVSNNRIQQVGLTILNSQTYTLSGYFKNNTMTTGQTFDLRLNNFASSPNDLLPVARVALADGTVTNQSSGSGVSATSVAITSLSNGWYRVSVAFTVGSGAGTTNAAVQIIRTSSAASFYAFGFQLELGSLSAYQKVGLTSDVEEQGRRSCYGLLFDGSDDFLQTASVDFSATEKMTVMAGVRKLSDAARGTICELTATIASNNGGFHLTAPNAASATFAFESKGTLLTDAVASSISAPATRVLSGTGDISGDTAIIRVNGVVADTDTGDQGTGNYANAILYIGSRGGSSLRFNGLIYTLIVRGATTPTATIADFEKNLLRIRAGLGPF